MTSPQIRFQICLLLLNLTDKTRRPASVVVPPVRYCMVSRQFGPRTLRSR